MQSVWLATVTNLTALSIECLIAPAQVVETRCRAHQEVIEQPLGHYLYFLAFVVVPRRDSVLSSRHRNRDAWPDGESLFH